MASEKAKKVKKGRPATGTPHKKLNLTKEDLIKALRFMMLARHSDEKHLTLVKQGKSYFHIGCSGHECIQVAVASNMEKKDWAWTYYRDMALAYTKGMTTKDYFLLAFAKKDCLASGGRQMPGHYGHPEHRMPTQSSPTGTQFLSAVGTALAARKSGLDEFVYVASGEGTTSQGEFYEAVNWAHREKLPVMFCIQDNKYAISVKREDQGMGGTVSDLFAGYDNLLKIHVDGTDYLKSTEAVREAIDYMRAGKGPVLIHADVERLLPHSSSDDHRKYRDLNSLEDAKNDRDCIAILSDYLIKNKLSTLDDIEDLRKGVIQELNDSADWAWEQEDPSAEDSTKQNFADPSTRNLNYSTSDPVSGDEIVMVDAINHALKEEMARNEKMLIFGEDIEDPKGGVFTATRGISDAFGRDRVFNSPLAEASIIGVALGLAINGYKPVVEIQFGDYIWPAFMQFKNEVAAMRFRSDGQWSAPVVTRVAVGGYIHGGLCHSQNIESIFSHVPGIMIAYPSNAIDAKGLLKTACRIQDPVLFCEHKGMYRLPFAKAIEPDENFLIPFGKARKVKEGADATIVTYGMCVKDSTNAVKKIEKETGKTVEIIDLRTIVPWDKDMVLDSVKKTGRVIVIHEDTQMSSVSGEIASTISDETFQWLDAPVKRLTAKDSHIPYHPNFEDDVLPSESKIYDRVMELLNY